MLLRVYLNIVTGLQEILAAATILFTCLVNYFILNSMAQSCVSHLLITINSTCKSKYINQTICRSMT